MTNFESCTFLTANKTLSENVLEVDKWTNNGKKIMHGLCNVLKQRRKDFKEKGSWTLICTNLNPSVQKKIKRLDLK